MNDPTFATVSSSHDKLIAGDFPRVTKDETILTGNNLARGTVLGKITASGKLVAVDNSKADGSENVYAILAKDTDASAADKVGLVYLSGEFNEGELVFGGDDDADDHRDAARALGLYFKSAMSA